MGDMYADVPEICQVRICISVFSWKECLEVNGSIMFLLFYFLTRLY